MLLQHMCLQMHLAATLSYTGQRQRLNMLSEASYLKSANTPGTALDTNTLLAMYANGDYIGTTQKALT